MGDLRYVKDFDFPSDRGFTGSAGKSTVKGYMRGGKVKKSVGQGGAHQKMPKTVKARGGTVGVVTEPGPKSRKPKANMTKAARGGSMHDKLMAEGGKMGYAKGGYAKAKDTSAEFDMRSKPMASMDSGTYPPQSSNEAEKEAGGRKRVRPKFKKGGKVARVRMITKRQKEHSDRMAKDSPANPDHSKGKGRSKKGMPKTVKAEGGLAKYADGGSVSPKDVPGTGGARRAADKIKERENRVRSTVNEALKSARASQSGGSPRPKPAKKDKPPKKGPKTIYREDENGTPTFTDVPKTGTPVRMRRARGGSVKKSEVRRIAKDVADSTMDRHIRAPRPKGHGTKPRGGRSRVRGGGY